MKLKRNLNRQHIFMYVERNEIVRDHCHFTVKFPGAAHEHCNLNYKIDKSKYKLPIVFHNLRGYELFFRRLNGSMVKLMLFGTIFNGTYHLMLDV